MIESIEREGTKLVVKITTGLDVKENILVFRWEATDEMFAEMLKFQLRDQLRIFIKKIAEYPEYSLESQEISKLKSRLVHKWDGAKHCYKELNK